jgi:hypothetical protein
LIRKSISISISLLLFFQFNNQKSGWRIIATAFF